MTVGELYHKVVKPLTVRERLKLVELIASDLSTGQSSDLPADGADLSRLRGLAAEIWKDIDAQDYVDQLRSEWDRPERYG